MRLFTDEKQTIEVEAHGIKVVARRVLTSEGSKIRQKHTSIGDKRQILIDDGLVARDHFAASVVSWNAEDMDGKPLPCTDEMKKSVFELNPSFVAEVNAAVGREFVRLQEVKSAEEKN